MCADRRLFVALCLFGALAGRANAQPVPHPAPSAAAPAARGVTPAPAPAPATAAAQSASAMPPASPAWVASTADELTQLQDRTLVLQAQLKELQAQQAVDAQQRKPDDSPPPTRSNVRVTGIEGFGGRRFATVQVDGGGEFDIAPGDALSDGAKVVSIGSDTVAVRERGGRLVRLRVGAGQAAPGGMNALPGSGAPVFGARE
jgi:type IV pilus biogenesis protein PilP